MEGVLVDPGGEAEKLMSEAKKLGITLKEIWLTHGHLDHAGAAEDIRAELSLVRDELDLLKRAFRRHCVETEGAD